MSIDSIKLAILISTLSFTCPVAYSQSLPNGFTQCAKEGEQCQFQGTAEVWYGVPGKWKTTTASNAINCDNTSFGKDPASGVVKACYVSSSASLLMLPSGFRQCAKEGEQCQFIGTTEVWFGAGNRWERKSVENGISCANGSFAKDPVPGTVKACYVLSSAGDLPAPGKRASYGNDTSYKDTGVGDSHYEWTGGGERTIYNPLDGGVLLKYTMPKPNNTDGCSAGAPREKQLFLNACLAHDTNYDAPFPAAGFPSYPNGGSVGQEISDYLFYKDMQSINDEARSKNTGITNWVNDSAADSFYMGVTLGGNFRGSSTGKTVLAHGGVVAVENKGVYIVTLRVKWQDQAGNSYSQEVTKPVGWTAVVPLSIGAKNIEIESWAVGGTTIFTKKFDGPGMYAYTVYGTTLIHSVSDGLKDNLRNNFNESFTGKETRDERTITFFNQAGYVAAMVVRYYIMDPKVGSIEKEVVTEKITAGLRRSVAIPKDIVGSVPIKVIIRGTATLPSELFTTTVGTDFGGDKCFKAWGTFAAPKGGNCN